MAKLTANTIVTHPDSGAPTVLFEGADVPAWAKDLVGSHLTAPEKPAKASPKPSTDK